MVTVGKLVNSAALPEERKVYVKQVLHQLGYPASRVANTAFFAFFLGFFTAPKFIPKWKQLTDAGLSIPDALAIFAEVAPHIGAHLLVYSSSFASSASTSQGSGVTQSFDTQRQ